MSLLEMSLSGAVMIVVIVVIRALAINRLPKKTFLALWGITLMRLLIPYSVPSAFSVYSLLGRLLSPAKAEPFSASASAVLPANLPVPGTGIVPSAPAASAVFPAVPPYRLVWMAGALICAAFFAAAYLKCRREFREALPVDCNFAKDWLKEHRLSRPIRLRQSDRISAPLTYGVFCPVILLPKHINWDDNMALAYVLTHEYIHIRRFDAATKMVLAAALCIHWFNPAVWILYVLANRDLELSCDETVIRLFGEGTKSAYAMTLIRMEENRSGLRPLCSNFSKHATEERIIAIMKTKKISLAAVIAAAALVAGVTAAFATSGQAAAQGNIDQEFSAASGWNNVEWWTAEEYSAWLDQEKINLQSIIGSRNWTPSTGWFTWTQEMVDETLAQYEQTLKDIQAGQKISKPISDGDRMILFGYEPDVQTSVTDSQAMIAPQATQEADAFGLAGDAGGTTFAERFSKYKDFGITYVEADGASGRGNVYLNGSLVSRFADAAPDGSTFSFASAEAGGMIVHTEYDSHGNLIGVQEMLPDAAKREAKGQ